MALYAIVFGVILIPIGLMSYYFRPEAITALIPAFLGGFLCILGLLALKDSLRKHAMHAAAAVGLLGVLGALYRVVNNLRVNNAVDWYAAATVALCALFVALCVRSFIVVRRNRERQANP